MAQQICKHCGDKFEPRPGKPGFINECEPCIEERRPSPLEADLEASLRLKAGPAKPARQVSFATAQRNLARAAQDLFNCLPLDAKNELDRKLIANLKSLGARSRR